MEAFHSDQKIKTKYLKRVKAHALADEIVKGQYWEDGKGCAVGCTIHSSDHSAYESELGIPEWLARVEDTIFEGLNNRKAKVWPERFLKAIKPGAKLDSVKTPFLIYILEQNLIYLDAVKFDEEKWPDVKRAVAGSRAAVVEMIRCHREGDDASAESAWSAARSAAESAWSAARSAAESAWSAARSAAESAWSAASAAYENYADKLVELLKACE